MKTSAIPLALVAMTGAACAPKPEPPPVCDRDTIHVLAQTVFAAPLGSSSIGGFSINQDFCAAVDVVSITLTGSSAFAVVPYLPDAGNFDGYNDEGYGYGGGEEYPGIAIQFTATDLLEHDATLTIVTTSATTPSLYYDLVGQGFPPGPSCTTDADCTGDTSCDGTYCLPGYCAIGLGDGGAIGGPHRACAPESMACAVDAGWLVIDRTSDVHNCGTCGNVCPPGQGCAGGRCGSCPAYRIGSEIDYPIQFAGFASGEGFETTGLAVGDFDGDGLPDVLVSTTVSAPAQSGVGLLILNDGDGGFGGPARQISAAPGGLQIADFNGDCALDVAASGSILLGDGHGNFPHRNCDLVDPTAEVLAADANGDGIPDLIFDSSHQRLDTAYVALSDGRGRLSALPKLDEVFDAMASGDFDGDGHPDVLGIWWYAGWQFGVYLDSDGGQPALSVQYSGISEESFVSSTATGDVAGRGHDAVVLSQAETGNVLVIPDPSVGFAGVLTLGVDAGIGEVALGDLDLDGHPDIVATEQHGAWVEGESSLVFPPDGGYALDVWTGLAGNGGTLGSGAMQSVNTLELAAFPHIADVNGDGIPDIIAVSSVPTTNLPSPAPRIKVMVFLGSCQQ